MDGLTFDAPTHTYRWNGVAVPSVTTIIKPIAPSYNFVTPEQLERARQEGVAIHRMVELECKRDLDESGLPDWLAPYLKAWRDFVAETGFECVLSEHRGYHKDLRYAGTLDLRGYNRKGSPWLIDIKRSFLAGRAIGVQLAAYAAFDKQERPKRFGLRLLNNGDYRLREFADPSDWSTFVACLTLHRFNERSDV
ncbi:MAG: hypothetical protein ING91_19330 [Rhodocyclaceae bacterium]|nr:hypothetical protein [Rhodocyclaceae bacterium]MCA3116387.1 hypothetical protein [Rhodocyclaceae bacterium]MCA3127062.1 hypothetical protein [Rhodocyclaceae bacterium]